MIPNAYPNFVRRNVLGGFGEGEKASSNRDIGGTAAVEVQS
jgi:hypothetical protein